MKIVVIAGGRGTRIASVNADIPKAMIPVGGKPVLEHQLEMALRQGFRDFIFVTGHLGDAISAHFGDGSAWGANIEYFRETQPMGTAGALACLKDRLQEDFFVFYGDTVMDVDLAAMLRSHTANSADATLLVHPNDHPFDSDIVFLAGDGRVEGFAFKPHPEGFISRNLVNASLFIFSPRVTERIEPGVKSHIEKDVLPRCLRDGLRVFGYRSAEYIKDMGTPERYLQVSRDVALGRVERMNRSHPRPAFFLDRDGTLNREAGFLNRAEQMELLPGAAAAVRLINSSGCLAIVVTNQPVIARGECTWEELNLINAKLETLLGAENAYLDDIYVCPHHPDRGFPGERPEYKTACDCRKPRPGMLLRAAREWNIDLSRSFMIGDSERDVQAGGNAGVLRSVQVETNRDGALLEAVRQCLENEKKQIQ